MIHPSLINYNRGVRERRWMDDPSDASYTAMMMMMMMMMSEWWTMQWIVYSTVWSMPGVQWPTHRARGRPWGSRTYPLSTVAPRCGSTSRINYTPTGRDQSGSEYESGPVLVIHTNNSCFMSRHFTRVSSITLPTGKWQWYTHTQPGHWASGISRERLRPSSTLCPPSLNSVH